MLTLTHSPIYLLTYWHCTEPWATSSTSRWCSTPGSTRYPSTLPVSSLCCCAVLSPPLLLPHVPYDTHFPVLCVQIITAEPDVTLTQLEAGDRFFILACDGVWDCLSNQQAVGANTPLLPTLSTVYLPFFSSIYISIIVCVNSVIS